MPPISSTTISLRSRISAKSPSDRLRTPAISGRRAAMPATSSARAATSSANAPPTVPLPKTPIRATSLIARRQVLVGLAADDHARVALAAEDHRGARDAVVVRGHRVAVGAGGRGHEDV